MSKARWKERPVVTAKAAGSALRFPEPFHKNLVESVEGYAARVLDLLTRPGERGKFGRPGREYVGKHVLLLRLLRDELRLIKQVVQTA